MTTIWGSPAADAELHLNGTLKLGSADDFHKHERNVRRVQEWLTLHGHSVVLDSKFGVATEAAVRAFQQEVGLPTTGVVDLDTHIALFEPMAKALTMEERTTDSLGQTIVRYAYRHLAQHPREVGGANAGPWVRLYMDGKEGSEWPWCAGFATLVVQQAQRTVGLPKALERTFSCDVLAQQAQARGVFLASPQGKDRERVLPGSLFLVRRNPRDWVHVGIVITNEGDTFRTIEGNTNDSGSREGFEVCARVRAFSEKVDFYLL